MNKSETITKITEALLIAQKEINTVKKNAENPFFKSRYADLASVIDACKPELNKVGIIALQPINGDKVETILIHISGEWLSSETNIVCAKQNDPQAYGSAITYARRYGLQSFNLLPSEDDDGESAMDRKKTAPQKIESDVDYAINNIKGFVKALNALTTETDGAEVGRLLTLGDMVLHNKRAGEQMKNWVSEAMDSVGDRLGINLGQNGK